MPGLNPTDAEIGQAIVNDLSRFGRFVAPGFAAAGRALRGAAPGAMDIINRGAYNLASPADRALGQAVMGAFSGARGGKQRPRQTGIDTGKYGPTDWNPSANPPTPIVTGLDRGGNIDRTQSDQYRAAMGQQAPQRPSYPNTPEGTRQRWASSEFNPYFGAASGGANFPKNVADMEALAYQRTAPGKTPTDLATYYRSQSAAGQANIDEIINALEYKGTPMEDWARKNQMLAFREYSKKFPGGRSTSPFPAGSVANLNVPVEGAFAAGPLTPGAPEARQEGMAFPGPGFLPGAKPFGMPALVQTGAPAPSSFQGMDTSQLYGKGAPNLAAFTQPGGAMTQGLNVSAPFQQASNIASLYTNPQNAAGIGEMEQSDKDLQSRIQSFLSKPGIR